MPLLPAGESLHAEPLIPARHQGGNFEANPHNLPISKNGLLCQATKQKRKGLPESKTWGSSRLVLSWAPAAQHKRQQQQILPLSPDKKQRLRSFTTITGLRDSIAAVMAWQSVSGNKCWGKKKNPAAYCCFLHFHCDPITTAYVDTNLLQKVTQQ